MDSTWCVTILYRDSSCSLLWYHNKNKINQLPTSDEQLSATTKSLLSLLNLTQGQKSRRHFPKGEEIDMQILMSEWELADGCLPIIPLTRIKHAQDFLDSFLIQVMDKLVCSIQNTNELVNGLLKDYYRQKKGIAMGPVIGPKLADIYMITIDERILTLTVSSKDIEDYANRLQENLNFTNEDEQQQELNFLDVVIKREETRVLFQTKKNVFIMELRKILNRTTLQENIDIEIKQLFKKFLLNDNPKYILFANQKNKMLNVISIVNNEDTNMHKDQFKIAGVVYRMSCTCQNPNYYIGETGRKLELRINTRQLSDLEGWNRCGSYIVMNLIVI
ncbi:uncharacterized protein LOC111638481 [Centruroides sculpturatus]|uniref:uncharacterized protein LOC111638481 n=1 Tax=Centruroides sculpturatus TaxID=218467 RepID=UPI000C6CF95F|nr:uncharacterized protein LOC111638481 [Centruroides sculpturatus]